MWFMVNRLADDYVYHTLVRPDANNFARQKGWNTFRFDKEQTKAVENFAAERVKNGLLQYQADFIYSLNSDLTCSNLKSFDFKLPWGRTFEAEIDFEFECEKVGEIKLK